MDGALGFAEINEQQVEFLPARTLMQGLFPVTGSGHHELGHVEYSHHEQGHVEYSHHEYSHQVSKPGVPFGETINQGLVVVNDG